MFGTLKSKLLTLIVVIMGVTGATVLYFTNRDVGRAMLAAEASSARNVLNLTELHLKGGYNRLISDKVDILARLKNQLSDMTGVGVSVVDGLRKLARSGTVTEETAKELALDWLRSLEFDRGYLFVLAENGTVLASGDPRAQGVSLAEVHDFRGQRLINDIRYDALPKGGSSAVFVWPRHWAPPGRKVMGFFLPIEDWKWTLGGTVDFEDIEAESQKELEMIISVLGRTFKDVRIGESGYVFLFDGDQRVLVPPPGVNLEGTDPSSIKGSLRTLAAAAGQGGSALIRDPFAAEPIQAHALTSYFKALDWYLSVVVPLDEIQEPADSLVRSQGLIIGFVVFVGLLGAFLFITKLSAPLNALATYAKALPSQDFTVDTEEADPLIKTFSRRYSRDEVGRLARAFSFMEQELRSNIRQAIATRAAQEKERLEKEAVEKTSRAKDEFLAHMSHEIRTPIHGILGLIDLLLESKLNSKQRRFTRAIRNSSELLLSVINDILDFSKIEALKLTLEETEFELGELVESVVEQFAESAQAKDLDLSCLVAPECYGTFVGDPARLRQILNNLCSNALKFTGEGDILVRVSMVDQDASQSRLRFEVRDTGVGISPTQLAKIFEPFAQGDKSTSRRFGGTGLGLSICTRLVELMNGEIGVESEEGRGSSFWFTATLRQDTARVPATPEVPIAVDRVLFVHDNPNTCSVFCERLAQVGVDVATAREASEALGQLCLAIESGHPLDAVFVDRPTDVDAFALARAIRSDPRLSDLPVILLVPMVGHEELEHSALELDAVCLTKPIRQSVLRECLGGKSALREIFKSGQLKVEPPKRDGLRLDAHILVAEDNPLNQVLTLEMLAKTGCRTTLVHDGMEAVKAFESQRVDLILMDCQMPELDGYAATRSIREIEARTESLARTPIIALTANAQRQDREDCYAAGLDDYLSKPFGVEQLLEKLSNWLPDKMSADPPEVSSSTPSTSISLDQTSLDNIRAAGNDGEELLRKLINIYIDDAPSLIEAVRVSIAASDSAGARMAAHRLKSNSANLGAFELAELCKKLEGLAQTDDLNGAEELLARISDLVPAVLLQLEAERDAAAPRAVPA